MEDSAIVELYLQRNETAISETDVKYGRYLSKIAYNILADIEDSKESVNETYLRAWNSIPPRKPCVLSTYLGKITRQLSIDIFRRKKQSETPVGVYRFTFRAGGYLRRKRHRE